MALREIQVDGFGHFHAFTLRDLGPGLTVLHGPNEAGKTTLTAFITYVLFGALRGVRPVALAGGRPGGRLVFDTDGGALVLERVEGRPPSARRADGSILQGEEEIRRLLAGLDRAMYRAVWSFALEDLRSFERLGEAELRDRLFTGAIAGAGRSVSAAVARLERRKETLWRPRASSILGDAQRRLSEVEARLDTARRRTGELRRLRSEREEAAAEHRRQVDARVRAEAEARRWTALVEALPHHESLAAAEARLAELPEGRDVGEATLAEVRRVDAALVSASAKTDAAQGHLAQRSADLDALPSPTPLLALAAEVEALARQAAELPAEREATLREQAARARQRVSEALKEAGLRDLDALAAFDRSPESVRRLREAARAAEEYESRRRDLREVSTEAGRRAEEARLAEEQLGALPRDPQAVRAAPTVMDIRRDEARATDARRHAETVARRQNEVQAELAPLAIALGPEAERASTDPVARSSLGDAVRRLLSAQTAQEARRESARELVDRRTERVAELRRRLDETPAAGEAHEATERVVRGVDRALEAFAEAARANRASEEDGLALSDVVRRLGWGVDTFAGAAADAGSAQRLRSASRALDEAQRLELLAEAALETAVTAAAREDVDVFGPGPGLRELEERELRLDEAEAAIRARDESRARSTAAQVPPWAAWFGMAIGVALLVLGVLTAVLGPVAAGVVVAVLGLVVVVGSRSWLHGGRKPPSNIATSEALEALGLGADASSAAVARLRAELRRSRRDATLREQYARMVSALEDRQSQRDQAAQAWALALTSTGWPAGLVPEALEAALADVLRGRELVERSDALTRRATAHRQEWEAWLAEASVVAATLERSVPHDAASARSLVDAAREAERAREESLRARRELIDALRGAEAELRAAEADGVRTEQTLAELAGRRAEIRRQASALGVPASTPLDLAEAWLARAGRLADLRAFARDLQSQREGHDEVVASWEARLAEVVLGRLGCTGSEALADAEARCRTAAEQERAWQEADQCRRDLARQRGEVLGRCRAIEAELSARGDSAAAWSKACAMAGAPAGLSPAGLEDLLVAAQRARRAQDEVEEHEAAAGAVADATAALIVAVAPVARALGAEPPASARAAQDLMRQAERALSEDRERAHQRERTREQVRATEERVDELRREQRELHSQLRALLDRHPADDVPDLERLHAAHVDHARARQDVVSAKTARRAALGDLADDEATLSTLDAPDSDRWRVAADLAATRAEDAQAAADAAIARRAERSSELDLLGGSTEIATFGAEAASLQAELRTGRRELSRLALAQALLERTLQRFREAHQPQILRRAGGYFGTVTRGAYLAVEPDAQGRGLLLVDREGGRHRPESLSTGTTELLYLVLRLGLAHDLSSRSAPVPMVLDDVLVNLDPERAAAVADLLAEVATEHQMLLLTCRPETRDLLVARVPNARVVELPRFAGRSAPAGGSIGVGRAAEGGGLDLAAEQILDTLARAPDALGRQELLEQTGIAMGAWKAAIEQLKNAGLVVQEGTKRSARYRSVT